MKTFALNIREIERHQLILSFETYRLAGKSLETLIKSLGEHGQITPVIAVGDEEGPWTLIDGYRRWEALGRCECDTIQAEIWHCDLATGLLRLLARESNRKRDALEEACFIRELMETHEKTKQEIAASLGRDPSWVSRRLQLLEEMRPEWWKGIQAGRLSQWGASRVLAPLARANETHAEHLWAAQEKEPLSTRELTTWFEHYKKAANPQRERMAMKPHLFLKALTSKQKEAEAKQLAAGLEGRCQQDMDTLQRVIRRLTQNLPRVMVGADASEAASVRGQLEKTHELLENLIQPLAKEQYEHQRRNDQPDPLPVSKGRVETTDQQTGEKVEKHGQESADKRSQGDGQSGACDSRGPTQEPIQNVQGQRCAHPRNTTRYAPDKHRLQHLDLSDPRGSPT